MKKNGPDSCAVSPISESHPSIFELRTFTLCCVMGLLGVVIGIELLTRVGITPNTSIVAAVLTVAVSRIPIQVCRSFRSIPRQNLVQTAISGATFGGANALFLPIGVVWLLGRPDLVPAMTVGASLGLLVGATLVYLIFDSKAYAAGGPWPDGIATAECIRAGDEGGKRARLLGVGTVIGCLGQLSGMPMDIVGVCSLGNVCALAMFGTGLLVRGYMPGLLNVDIEAIYLPHGTMVGAGIVAVLQLGHSIMRSKRPSEDPNGTSVADAQLRRSIGFIFLAMAGIVAIMTGLAGVWGQLPPAMLCGFIIFTAVAAMVSVLVVGISAMQVGWFPAFALTLIFLVIGMLLGFPEVPLALAAGFTASTGPAFADMAFDLKAGWILRGRGKHPQFERQGRTQQYFAELLGFGVAAAFVLVFSTSYFNRDLFPPVDRVYVSTILAGVQPQVAKYLLLWALPGALIQFVGGGARQIGVLFATGLLIAYPLAGWVTLLTLLIRVALVKRYGPAIQDRLYILAGGFIIGSVLSNFGTATIRAK